MTPILEQQRAHYARKARGVVTNGVGRRTTAHLNLERTLARTRRLPKLLTGERLTEAEQKVLEGYDANLTTSEIASLAGITTGSVKVLASRIGVRRPPKALAPPPASRRPPYAGYDRYERPWG